jgi:hypothetical protein
MNVMLSIKEIICVYWGFVPIVVILMTIGLLKLSYIKNLWHIQ